MSCYKEMLVWDIYVPALKIDTQPPRDGLSGDGVFISTDPVFRSGG
jgi:hypothetical protein